jgi:hypothetical protein
MIIARVRRESKIGSVKRADQLGSQFLGCSNDEIRN